MKARRWRQASALCLGSLLLWVTGANSQEMRVNQSWWLAGSLAAGAVSPDQDLADFRWVTTPASLYAVQAVAGHGRLAGGLRFSRWATTQGTGLPTVPGGQPAGADPEVLLRHVDLIGQVRAISWQGWEVWGTALAGRVRLTYTPDQLTLSNGGTGGDLTVNYEPITETNLGLGLELKRALGRRLSTSLAAERTGFGLETSHRRGAEIVRERQTFNNWNLRLQVAWVFDLG